MGVVLCSLAVFLAFYLIPTEVFGQRALSIIFAAWVILTSLCLLIVSALRLHDLNMSAWWLLLLIIPVILKFPLLNIVPLFLLMIVPGDKKANRFGDPPSTRSTLRNKPESSLHNP